MLDKAVRQWLSRAGVRPLYIEPESPWENGYIESFRGKLRDQLLNGEPFCTLGEAQVVIERWRQSYNQVRPHGASGFRPAAPETLEPQPICASLTLRVVQPLGAAQRGPQGFFLRSYLCLRVPCAFSHIFIYSSADIKMGRSCNEFNPMFFISWIKSGNIP